MVSDESESESESESSRPASRERIAGLVREHYAFVWRLLRRLGMSPGDADDAAQQVFLAAAVRLGTVRDGRERAFLYGVALNVGARARRSLGRRREEPFESAGEPATHELNGEQLLEQRQARALLDQLLDEMPDDLRVVFVLYELEELSTRQIAEICEIPLGTAASRLRRARADFEERVARAEARRSFSGGER
ncbi:MAG TPA: sigma-70 family RNA polymerase sigma factor [Polyangiaceae bacterium]|nr:sigma-70 family RNA polymerase sigma factor [Polyangiaceae bacterium]